MQVEPDFEPVVFAVAAAAVLAAVLVELVGVAAVEIVKKANGEFVSAAVIAVVVVAAAVLVSAAVEVIDMLNLVLVPLAAAAFHCVFETMMICPY